MPIKLTCPNCQRTLMVPKSDAGKAAMCNACGQRLQIPRLPPSLTDLSKLDPPAEPLITPGLSKPPEIDARSLSTGTPLEGRGGGLQSQIVNSKSQITSPHNTPPIESRTRDQTRGSLMPWSIATVVILLLAGALWWTLHKHSPDVWETDNRAAILSMIDAADGALISGNLQAAAQKYRDVEAFVGDHPITDPALRARLEVANAQKVKVLAALPSRLTSPRSIPVAPKPVEPIASRPAATDPVASTEPATKPVPAEVVLPPPLPNPPVAQSFLHPAKQTPDPEPLNDARIGAAIEKGADWLIRRFDPATHQLAGDPERVQYRGGLDALCVYALLQAGMAIHDDRLDIHKDFLKGLLAKLDTLSMGERQTYGRGLRASALALYNRKEDRRTLQLDVTWLLKNHRAGAYGYNEPMGPNSWDNSNTQYGQLGVWSAADVDVEVPSSYWTAVQHHWEKYQADSGGWAYDSRFGGATLSMTLAGVASLFVCHDYLDPTTGTGNVGRPPFSPALAKGLEWLESGDHFNEAGMMWGYTLYGIERVGLASGFKFFGKHDWFRERALDALEQQQADGSWGGNEYDTAYALLFLARGRHPIIMNKLRFDGFWSNRPRDCFNLARFASRELERPLNFQVVNIDRDWTDWTDSPVLYLASHEAPNLTDAQIDNLRRFIENGGLLFTQADGGAPPFDKFAEELAKKLFPQYPMRPAPKEHLVYSMLYKLDPAPPLKMVSNGVRALMIHSPQDVSIAWQQRMERSRPAMFQLGVNIFLYAAGKTDLKNRVGSNVLPEPKSASGGKINVARLRYDGAWDPEPAAWPRFARWFQWETSCAVDIVPVDLASLNPKTAPFAHLTGAAAVTPTPAQAAAIRSYVDGGGTLFIDAAGGSRAFSDSAIQLLAKAFPDASLKKLPTTHPLLNATFPGMETLADPPLLRSFALNQLDKTAGGFEGLTHGRGRVIATSLDVTTALLATRTWGILGHSSDYSQAFLKNALLWTAGGAPDKAK